MPTVSRGPPRLRIGHVSLYCHHGQQWLYYRDRGEVVRRPAGAIGLAAEAIASVINAKLAARAAGVDLARIMADHLPDLTAVAPTTAMARLQQCFLNHHESVLGSARGTINRYRTATNYVVRHAGPNADPLGLDVAAFIGALRLLQVTPNGHTNTAKRGLRDKGLKYILQTCRTMYRYGQRHGLIPGSAPNPFTAYPIERLAIRDRKPVFVFTAGQQHAFFANAPGLPFVVHMVLATTGLRPAELTHLMIEDVDLDGAWLHVRSKPELGWTTKTNLERSVPLCHEVVKLLRSVVNGRSAGLVFVRRADLPLVGLDRASLAGIAAANLGSLSAETRSDRVIAEQNYRACWRDAGLIDTDWVRLTFIRIANAAGLPAHATCPKSWRHTFATLMQQAKVDLLIRQEVLGHKPSDLAASALGMTGVYTHTDPETLRAQIESAVRLRADTLKLISNADLGTGKEA